MQIEKQPKIKYDVLKILNLLNCSQARPIDPVSSYWTKIKSRHPKDTQTINFAENFKFKWDKSPKESCFKSKKVVRRKAWLRAKPKGYLSNFF